MHTQTVQFLQAQEPDRVAQRTAPTRISRAGRSERPRPGPAGPPAGGATEAPRGGGCARGGPWAAGAAPGDGGGSFRAVTAPPAASLALKMADGADRGALAGAAGGRAAAQAPERAMVRLQTGAAPRFSLRALGSSPCPLRAAAPPLGRPGLALRGCRVAPWRAGTRRSAPPEPAGGGGSSRGVGAGAGGPVPPCRPLPAACSGCGSGARRLCPGSGEPAVMGPRGRGLPQFPAASLSPCPGSSVALNDGIE